MHMNTRDAETVSRHDALCRERVLSHAQSAELERALRRSERKGQRPWLPRDDLALRQAVRRRRRVSVIAVMLGRTEAAVWRRMAKLRKQGKIGYISPVGSTGRYPRKSSKGSESADMVS